jgi:DNA-binding MarR family transcriptional regulator
MNQESEFKKHLKSVDAFSVNELADALEFEIIQTASVSLLKRWFPTKVPTDIEKWAEIAYEDVVAMLKALNEDGYVVTKKDERTDK